MAAAPSPLSSLQICSISLGLLVFNQMCACLSIAIRFALAVHLFTCIHAFSPSTKGANLSEPDACYFLCYEKYLSKSYFAEHETLIDSSFQDFLADKVHAHPELAFTQMYDLRRHLIGEGSHRLLRSSIRLNILQDSISDLPVQQCKIVVFEKLPLGVFADPFELEHLLQRGVFQGAAIFGDTNLELPSFLSNRSLVEIHMDVAMNISSGGNNNLDLKVEIPLHARYPPLDQSGYSQVRFGLPDFFMHCNIDGKSSAQNFSIMPIVLVSDLKPDAVVWSIPCGIKAHETVVSVITFASALLSAILIIIASVKQSDIRSHKTLKQS